MVNEEKERMNSEIAEAVDELAERFEAVSFPVADDCTDMQQLLIERGEYLERKYGLEGSEFIGCLEDICEMLYEFSQDEVPREEWDNIIREIRELPRLLENSCKERVLSIGVIIRDEMPYLREWMEYHLMLGVEHFYIYDNNSKDGLYEFLVDYINRGLVTYMTMPVCDQLWAYGNACDSFKYATKYLALIDVDEFLVPVQDKTLPDVFEEIFAEYPYAGGIGVNWRVYGTSFYDTKPDGMIIENYLYRQNSVGKANLTKKFNIADNSHVKTVCNPRRVTACNNPHFFEYMSGTYQISEYGTVFNGPFFAEGRGDKIRLNHYYTKSKEEFYERRRRGFGTAYLSEAAIDALWDMYKDVCNEYKDEIMLRYVKPLRERLA